MAETNHGHVERIRDEIKAMVLDRTLAAGERINESTLARKLGASRTPVREALNRLVGEGLIEALPGKGFFCRGVDPSTVPGILAARAVIERELTRLAVRNGSREDAERLVAMTDDEQAFNDGSTADEAFHNEIARMAGNPSLVRILDEIRACTRFLYEDGSTTSRESSAREHRAIARAIADGKGWKAMLAMNEHLENEAMALTRQQPAGAPLSEEEARTCEDMLA